MLSIIFFALIWVKNVKKREYIVSVAKNFCKKNHLQFLDDSVSYQSSYTIKVDDRRIKVKYYQFAVSYENHQRIKGIIKLYNDRLEDIYIEDNNENAKKVDDNIINFYPRFRDNKDQL